MQASVQRSVNVPVVTKKEEFDISQIAARNQKCLTCLLWS